MKFIFEVHTNDKLENINIATVDRLRKMMLCFEVMINTTLPEQRIHLKEE